MRTKHCEKSLPLALAIALLLVPALSITSAQTGGYSSHIASWTDNTARLSISISPSYQSGLPGEKLVYTIEIKNNENANGDYYSAVTDNLGWKLEFDFKRIILDPFGEVWTILKTTIPENAIGGVDDNVVVTMISTDNTASYSASCIAHVNVPIQWQLIETCVGTVAAPAQWQLIETWTGTMSAPAQWKFIETWIGAISTPAEWQLVETWTGTVTAPAAWQLIETWTGTVSAPTAWQVVETWTGAIQAPTSPPPPPPSEDNTPPPTPSLISPTNGAHIADNTPTFKWFAVSDPSGVTYTLQVDNNSDFTSPEVNISGLTENTYTPSDLADENYSWRVRAVDGARNLGGWSTIWTLLIDTTAPAAPRLLDPFNGALTNDNTPTFRWTVVIDNSLPVAYDIQVDNEASFTSPYVYHKTGILDNWYTFEDELPDGTYYWRVRAIDNMGNVGEWAENFKFDIVISTNVLPTRPLLISPANGENMSDNTPTFKWTPGLNASNHRLLVDNDPDFSSPIDNILLSATDNTLTKPGPGYVDGTYYWKVIAINAAGENSSLTWTFRVETAPSIVLPPGPPWVIVIVLLGCATIAAIALYTRHKSSRHVVLRRSSSR